MQKSRLIGVEDAERLEVIVASTIHGARNRKDPDATNLLRLLTSVSALSHGTHPWGSYLASNIDLLEDFSRIFKPFLTHIRDLDELQRALESRFVFDAYVFMDANAKGPNRPFRCFFRDCDKSSEKPLEQLWDLQRHLSFEHRIYIELIGEGKFSDRLLSFPLYSAIHPRETTKLTDRLTAITEEHLQSSVEQVDWSKLGGVLFLPSRMEFNPSEPGQGVSKSPCSDLARSENRCMRLFDDLLVSMRFQMRQKDLLNLLEIKTKAIDLCLTLKQSQDARGVGGERRDKLQGFQTTMIRLVIQLCDRLNLAQNLTDRYKAQVSSSACIRENSQSKEHVSLGSCDRVLSETSKMLEDMHVMSIHAAQSLLDQSVIQTSHQACESGATTGMASVLGCEDDRDTNLTSGLENCGLRSVCWADPTIFELVDEIYRTSKLLIDSLRAQVWSIPGLCTSASLLRVQRGMFHSFNGDGDDDGRKDWFEFRRSSHQVFNQKLESSLDDSSVVSLSQASSAVTSSQVKPTTGLAIYKYRPLDQAINEIRVLLVENREGRLHAKIRHISLDAWQDSYYALSYTWGGQTPTETILLEGGYTMRITPNLASAFRSKVISESASKAIPVWADAICINQADVAERNTEVLKMRRIYGQARCVIIWLGAEAQNSDEALEFLQNIDRFNSRRPLEALSPSDEQWQAIYHLFKRDWFTRVWTIQEAAVSHRPTFACGQKAVDLDHRKLSTIVHYLRTCAQSRPREQRHQYALNERAMRRLDTLSWLQTWWGNACSRTVPLQFLDVLVASRHAIASNPSDKIYGLLGLAVDAVQIIPRPDYTLSYPKVYASFVRDWIRYHGSLDVICHAGSSSSCDDHLPTWVPDWKDGAGGPSFCQKTWHSEGTGNVAQVDGFMDLPPVFSDDLTEMTIWAYVLGSLDSMAGSTCSTESLEAIDSNSNRRQQMSVYGTTEPTAQALQQICRMTTDNDQEWRDNFKDYVYAGRTIDCWLGTNEQYGGQSQGGSTSRFKPSEFSSSRFSSHNLDRRLFTLSTGHLGLGRDHIRVGDLVCLVPGCSAPLVIRKSLGSYFKFVGDAYLHPDGKTRGGPYGNWAIPYGTDKFTRLERFILV